MDTINSLAEKRVVIRRETEFSDVMVALNPDAVSMAAAFILRSQIPAYKYLYPGNPFKMPSLYHKLRLREGGWDEGDPENEFAVDAPMVYRKCAGPVSYFIALLACEHIFEKGFTAIRHDGYDSYYRCLLRISVDLVPGFMAQMNDQGQNWFKHQLNAIADVNEEIADGGA